MNVVKVIEKIIEKLGIIIISCIWSIMFFIQAILLICLSPFLLYFPIKYKIKKKYNGKIKNNYDLNEFD